MRTRLIVNECEEMRGQLKTARPNSRVALPLSRARVFGYHISFLI
jgi:hypothetical protein